ncbi:MotE family protein [Bacillus andreraoultii]|uniref:MotE family protein n=1 Tax=Bacillus andreraoultii TaxID=1499685 RepID=UPI00053AB0F7|nr:hypothetical protein [Bacillus andreraoultii]
MKKNEELIKENKPSFLKKILYYLILPLLIILTILLVIATVSGVNVFQEASKIPVIGSLFPSEANVKNAPDQYEQQLNKLQANLKNQEKKVQDLQAELEKKDQEIASLEEEKSRLESEQEKALDEGTKKQTDTSSKDIIKTYEKMKPKNAAAILTQMDEPTALSIMSQLKDETLASILENMTAENAAKFTGKLSKSS